CGDLAVDVVGKARLLSLDEVEDELPVALRPRQARVYDPDRLASPADRRLRDLAHDARLHVRIADDASPRLGASRLELRLDEDERVPAGRGEAQDRRQRELH